MSVAQFSIDELRCKLFAERDKLAEVSRELAQAQTAGLAAACDYARAMAAGEALADALRGVTNVVLHPKCTAADRRLLALEGRAALAQYEAAKGGAK